MRGLAQFEIRLSFLTADIEGYQRVLAHLAKGGGDERKPHDVCVQQVYWKIRILGPKRYLVQVGLRARVASDPRVGIFNLNCFVFIIMKRCPIAAKIAGSIEILPCCVLNDPGTFFT